MITIPSLGQKTGERRTAKSSGPSFAPAIVVFAILGASAGASSGQSTTSSALAADVSSILDNWQRTGLEPVAECNRLVASFGYVTAVDEIVRQAQDRNSTELLGSVLCAAEDDPHAKDLAVKSLHSKDQSLRESATNWCTANLKLFSPEEKKGLLKLVFDRFKASNGDEWLTVNQFATSANLPIIRSVYDAKYEKKKEEFNGGDYSLYPCAYSMVSVSPTRTTLLLLMARLGDAGAKGEVISALEQSKDPQRRCWGILMAVRLQWKQAIPLIARGLDDPTTAPERVDQLPDDQKRERVWQENYTRVCDVAVRAIAELAPPAKKWDFAVRPATEWAYGGTSSASQTYHEYLDTAWHADRKIYIIRNIVGFTSEQIAMVRDYAASLNKPARK